MAEPALVVEDYSFWYKLPEGERALALESVSFEVEQGDFMLVLGASGSGKSTLALNLVGIYPDYFGGHNQGRILINHRTKGLVNRRDLTAGERFDTVNMLFQNPEDQIVTLTVEEEVAFALENYLIPAADIPGRVSRALELVGLLGFQERSTIKLSGGEKQRVALAAMLAMEPSVLILDEPTSNLDPAGTEEVLAAVARVRSELDVTLLIVEHEVDEIFHQVNKVLLVDGKRVQGPDSPREFISKHGLEVRDRMGLWIPQASEAGLELERAGVKLSRTPLTGDELIDEVESASITVTTPPKPQGIPPADLPAGGHKDAVIQVRNVAFSYPTMPNVLRGVNLDIHRGKLTAIVGQNGSGKSTLAAHLNGLLKPTTGEVLVEGRPTTSYKFAELAKRVAYIFQTPEKQFIRKNVHEEMAHGLFALKLEKEELERRVDEVLQQVNLADRKNASPYVLSHGQKRRLSVACMVIAEPEVVVLDEPTFGQDWRQARRLMGFMRALADRGAAVAFITHDMRLVSEYADHCAVLCDGEIAFHGSPTEMFSSSEVLERARLRVPPLFSFSKRILGEPVLHRDAFLDRIQEVTSGRSRTVV